MTIDPQFLQSLKSQKNGISIPRSNSIPKNTAKKILQEIVETNELSSIEVALTHLTILFQQGGTSRSCDGNLTAFFEKNVSLSSIRKALKKNGFNRGERKLARTYANEIYAIAAALELDGNLYQKIQRLNPELSFTQSEACWLSDFQASNEETPSNLRNLINASFNKQKINSTTNPNKKTGK